MVRRCADRQQSLQNALSVYQHNHGPLPGLTTQSATDTLILQLIASLRRTEYISVLKSRKHSVDRLNPHHTMFDPITASHLLNRQGQLDEAVWLCFIATNFGKHSQDGWKLSANVYGSFGLGPVWTSTNYQANKQSFEQMLLQNSAVLSDASRAGRYSNHRQYVSRKPEAIAKTFDEMSQWLFANGSFSQLIRNVHVRSGQNPEAAFDEMYRSVRQVNSFGRLGAFDFLTMIGKLDLAPIFPGSTYLDGATGPLRGARLLFHGRTDFPRTGKQMQASFDLLDDYLQVGKQPLEDSICNWQKSPNVFVHFRG